MSQLLLKSEIKNENDIVWARKKARQLAEYLKLDNQDQIRLATAVSEIARNAFQYAGAGSIHFQIAKEKEKIWIQIAISDTGPGIQQLDRILSGVYVSTTGMGRGIAGAKKLVDDMSIESTPAAGTRIVLHKHVPHRKEVLKPEEIKVLIDGFMASTSNDPIEEVQKQNREILLTMDELQESKEALFQSNLLLEKSNSYIKELNAKLDEKAEKLKQISETKTSFLSDMTHELRSPLNSIISISQFLLEDAQEDQDPERELQVQFIIKASNGLSELVNDLLDIAKIEAGKIQIRTSEFAVMHLLGTLDGMMKQLVADQTKVALIISKFPEDTFMTADEGKVAQILRNLISNALKFTLAGEVTVSTRITEGKIVFDVTDTGIGIPADKLDSVFLEFSQVHSPTQDLHKGTGLGLPLSLKLAEALGGTLTLTSEVGVGSVFTLELPLHYQGPDETNYGSPLAALPRSSGMKESSLRLKRILMVDDDESNRYNVHRHLKDLPIDYKDAGDGEEAWELTQSFNPDLIILDLNMPKLNGTQFLKRCRATAATVDIPIILYTSQELEAGEREYLELLTKCIIYKDAFSSKKIREVVEKFIS